MPSYKYINVWADCLLNYPQHTTSFSKASHDSLAFCLSNLACRAGLSLSTVQSSFPVVEADTYLRKG